MKPTVRSVGTHVIGRWACSVTTDVDVVVLRSASASRLVRLFAALLFVTLDIAPVTEVRAHEAPRLDP